MQKKRGTNHYPAVAFRASAYVLVFLINDDYKVALRSPRKRLYAVLTGDLVESSKTSADDRDRVLTQLRSVFRSVDTAGREGFQIFRGDSFQTVLDQPRQALATALLLRCLCLQVVGLDMRLAIGVGPIEYRSRKSVGEGIGPAFIFSGKSLDGMRGLHRLVITTQDAAVNSAMAASTALLDAVISFWSENAVAVVIKRLQGKKQQAIADELEISQSAVNQRLGVARWWAVEAATKRWEEVAGLLVART